jgi:hypothetical protein
VGATKTALVHAVAGLVRFVFVKAIAQSGQKPKQEHEEYNILEDKYYANVKH